MKRNRLTAVITAVILLVGSIPFAVSAKNEIPKPIAYYHFDDSAFPGRDATGNGNDLEPKGEISIEKNGQAGNCVYFNGYSAMVAEADKNNMDFIDKLDGTTKQLTVMYWYNINEDDLFEPAGNGRRRVFSGGNTGYASPGGICSVNTPDSNLFPTYTFNNTMCDFPSGYGDQNINNQNVEFRSGEWIFIAFTVDCANNHCTYYVDGELLSDITTQNAENFKLSNTQIAYAFGCNYTLDTKGGTGEYIFDQGYIGKIDEAGIFDKCLTADQVKYYMQNGYDIEATKTTEKTETTAAVTTAEVTTVSETTATETTVSDTTVGEITTDAGTEDSDTSTSGIITEENTEGESTTEQTAEESDEKSNEDKESVLPWILAGIAVVAAAVVIFIIKKKK